VENGHVSLADKAQVEHIEHEAPESDSENEKK